MIAILLHVFDYCDKFEYLHISLKHIIHCDSIVFFEMQ